MKGTAILAAALLAIVSACSFSASSESISESVSSPFESISSSSSGDTETAFLDDVTDQTRTVVAAGGSPSDLRGNLGSVARAHGVSDWEGLEATYVAVGRGLAAANVGENQVDHFTRELARDDRRATLIRNGFTSIAN